MGKDELIRALASMRTDLNKVKLGVLSVPGQLDDETLNQHGIQIENSQEDALMHIDSAVNDLNELIKYLGGRS